MHHEVEILIGCGLVSLSLTSILSLTLWSRKIIERIAASDLQTARHLIKQLNGKE
jgi:hypothetical protein